MVLGVAYAMQKKKEKDNSKSKNNIQSDIPDTSISSIIRHSGIQLSTQ